MFDIKALRKDIARSIEQSFTRYYMNRSNDTALDRELQESKELKTILDNLTPGAQGAITGTIEKIERESTYKGFKQGFNLALKLLNLKPIFSEEDHD